MPPDCALVPINLTSPGKDNNNGKDNMTTGSINNPSRPDMEEAQKCRDHVAGGAPCQEPGTVMDMQQ